MCLANLELYLAKPSQNLSLQVTHAFSYTFLVAELGKAFLVVLSGRRLNLLLRFISYYCDLNHCNYPIELKHK